LFDAGRGTERWLETIKLRFVVACGRCRLYRIVTCDLVGTGVQAEKEVFLLPPSPRLTAGWSRKSLTNGEEAVSAALEAF